MNRTWKFAVLSLLAACGGGQERVLTGTLPAGASGAEARAGGQTIEATVDGKQIQLDLAGMGAVEVFVDADGVVLPLVFPADATGTVWDTTIPNFEGSIDLGQITLVNPTLLRSAEDESHAEAENNPLESIDCDGDGDSDFDDDDDDDDGVGDDLDDDDDNECEAGDDDDEEEEDDDEVDDD